jgi:hypothetical protein
MLISPDTVDGFSMQCDPLLPLFILNTHNLAAESAFHHRQADSYDPAVHQGVADSRKGRGGEALPGDRGAYGAHGGDRVVC